MVYNASMSKKLYYIVLNLIIIMMSFVVCFSIFYSNQNKQMNVYAETSNNQMNENLINKNSKYYYIDSPTRLTGDSTNFYVTDKDLNLYNYSNAEFKSISYNFKNLLDYKFVKSLNKIFALTDNELIELSAVDYSTISTQSDILGSKIDSNGVYLAVSNGNSIFVKTDDFQTTLSYYFIDEYNTSDFNDIKDICLYNNSIYLLDSNAKTSRVNLIKIDLTDDLAQSKATFVKQISFSIKNDFELNANQFGLILREESNLKLYSFAGNLISSLLNEYTHFERAFKSGEVISPSGIIVDNENIVIADKISNSIQLFKMSNNALIFQKLLVASSGADIDRLSGASDATLYGEDIVAISDKDNNRIIVHNLTSKSNTEIAINGKPSLVATTNTGSLYIYSRPNLICYESIEDIASGKEIKAPITTQIASSQENYNIVDMETSALNSLYMLDATTNSLLSFKNSESVKTVLNFNFSLSSESKIEIDASGKIAFVLNENAIYSIDLENKQISQLLESENELIDFSLDYKGNIYVLTKIVDTANENGSLLQIEKYNSNATFVGSKQLLSSYYSNLQLNINTGIFYAIDSIIQVVKEIAFNNEFTEILISFKNDTSFISKTPFTEKATIGKINKTTYSYRYPFMISPLMQFESGFDVIVLQKNCDANAKFAYCLIANKTANNILCYIPTDAIDFGDYDITPSFERVKVITAYAYLYKLPTSLKFEDNSELKLDKIAYQDDSFEIIGYASNFKDFYGNSYLTIKLDDNSICYMKSFNAMNFDLDVYQETFQPNAHLSIVLDSDIISLYEMQKAVNETTGESTTSYVSLNKNLDNNTKVFISKNDYSVDKDYTKIVYINENNEQLSAYVKTKFVCLDREMMPHVQIGLILLPISVILIVIVAIFASKFIKKRKIEEKLNQIENE